MYFDISPKTRQEDLFGMDYQLELFRSYLLDNSVRMIVIRGLRRVGKTSLLNVGLKEAGVKFVKIDVRDSPFRDRREFMIFLIKRIKEKIGGLWEKIIGKISGLGINYRSFSLELFFSREENITSFFENLNKQMKLILAFDEIQLLKSVGFDYFLASVFDNYKNIRIVITGSEIGVMDKFLGKNDDQAPLFGRAYLEIYVGKVKEETVSNFLEEGFKQIHKKIEFKEIRQVLENFDGIIGWVTYYGWFRAKDFSAKAAIEKVKEEGKIIVQRELENFLANRKSRNNYLKLVKYLAEGRNTWSLLKQNFNKKGIRLADSQLDLYLKELVDFGFVEKLNEQYFLVDPLLLEI